jgi:pyruvate/2-oxoglutarate dehydrogenase complex dihydrolipoamide acyltransferase (E2) component
VYRFGTFGVSNYGQWGAESLRPLSPTTTLLTIGPIGDDGHASVKIIYDHRVLDGAFVARCLAELEETLNAEIARELECGEHERAPQCAYAA